MLRNQHIKIFNETPTCTNITLEPKSLFRLKSSICPNSASLLRLPPTDSVYVENGEIPRVEVIRGQRINTVPNFRHFHRRLRHLCPHHTEPKVACTRTFLNPKQNKRMHAAILYACSIYTHFSVSKPSQYVCM